MPSKFRHNASLTLFGIAVTFESTDLRLLDIARACISSNKITLNANETKSSVYVVIERYAVNDRPVVTGHVDSNSLSLSFEATIIIADPKERRGTCLYLEGERGSAAFEEAINTLVLFLVAHAGRTPIHASAFMYDDVAVVLAGRSEAGKSTLALAAARAGLPVLSEDTVFVQHAPSRVWSRTQAIHVLAEDAPDCVEEGMRLRSGRLKRALPVSTVEYADRAILCVLQKGHKAALEPMDVREAIELLTRNPEPGYEFYGERSIDAVRALSRRGVYRLTLSSSAKEAIDLLLRAMPTLL